MEYLNLNILQDEEWDYSAFRDNLDPRHLTECGYANLYSGIAINRKYRWKD